MTQKTQPAKARRAKAKPSAFMKSPMTKGIAIIGSSGLVIGLGITGSGSARANGEIVCTEENTVTAVGSSTVDRNALQDELNDPGVEQTVCLSGDFVIDDAINFDGPKKIKGVGDSSSIRAVSGSVFASDFGEVNNIITIENLTLKDSVGYGIMAYEVVVKGSTFLRNTQTPIIGYSVTVSNSTFIDNDNDSDGGAIFGVNVAVSGSTFKDNSVPGYGGAIYAEEEAVVRNSTFVGNSALYGGAISSVSVDIENSTFVGNAATGVNSEGGAVYAGGGSVYFSTFVNNSASEPSEDPSDDTPGNAIYKSSDETFHIGASIFAQSTIEHPQLGYGLPASQPFTDSGANVFTTLDSTETDLTPDPSSRFGETLNSIFGTSSPVLSTYAPNLNGTQTIGLAAGSPALGIVPNTTPFDTFTLDQRGATRIDPRDAGAFQGVAPVGGSGSSADFTVFSLPTGITKPGSEVKVAGANLNLVKEVYVNGAKVKIKKQSAASLVFTAPRGLTGLVDVRFVSAASQYNAFRALDFGSSAVSGTKARTVVGGFAANSTRLSMKMKREIRAFLKTNSGLSSVTCMGFTSEPATALDTALAKARGQVTCNYIKKLDPDLKVKVVQGRHTELPGSKIRRVRITME